MSKKLDFIRELTEAVTKAGADKGSEVAERKINDLANTHSNRDFFKMINASDKQREIIEKGTKGIGVGRFVRCLAFGRGDVDRAKAFAARAWDDDLGGIIQKALIASDLTAGGSLIPPQFSLEVIELLRARSVVRAAGARQLDMPGGTLTMRRQTGTIAGSYIGESQDIGKTQPGTGLFTMTAKKLAAMVPISNDLLKYSAGPSADEFVRDDLIASLQIREDQAFIRDDGTQETPKGLRYWAAPANVIASAGTTSANIETDFRDLMNSLESSNVRMIRPVWLMHPTRKNFLINLRNGTGQLIFPEMRNAQPTLYGWPVFTTTNIPASLGGGAQSEVYFVDMNECIIGETSALEIAVDTSAAYLESGSLKSAFSRDETLMRAITRHDFAARHAEAIAVKTAVAWGG